VKTSTTYPLRLPASIRAEVAKLARREGISVNQFIALAVAQKVSALNAATWFAERRSRADMKAFDRLMRRQRGEPPRDEDRI
jgi:post-segregation antitoxin (ccd killing protein)